MDKVWDSLVQGIRLGVYVQGIRGYISRYVEYMCKIRLPPEGDVVVVTPALEAPGVVLSSHVVRCGCVCSLWYILYVTSLTIQVFI